MAKKKSKEEFEEFEDLDLEDDFQDNYAEDAEELEDGLLEEPEKTEDELEEEPSPDEDIEFVDEDMVELPEEDVQEEKIQVSTKPVFINMDAAYEDPETKARWYVVHTYSGHENKVKVNIEKIVENRGMQELVLNIVVPTEDVVEIKNGQRKVKTRKMFPGYVIVKMIVTNESWYLVRNTQGVTGFVGHGSEPVPLTNEEVRRMGIEKVHVELDIGLGDSVKVINGPFEGFMGVVEEVNLDKQTLKVRISMFGRDTPVELEFNQVDKL